MRRMNTLSHTYNKPNHILTALAAASFAAIPAMATAQISTPDDTSIVDAIETDLAFDSRVDSDRITTSVKDGVVTLKGTARTLAAKNRAIETARATRGVRSIVDRVTVRNTERPDTKIESDVRSALDANPATERFEVFAESENGHITLTGNVDSMTERWVATDIASSIKGVRSVTNLASVTKPITRPDAEIEEDVEQRLRRDIRIDGILINASVDDAQVTLTGVTGSAAERLLATRLAYVDGVEHVNNADLYVTFSYNDDMLKTMDQAPNYTDAQAADALRTALELDPRVSDHDVAFTVNNHHAVLSGYTDTLGARVAVSDAARNTAGIDTVTNLVKVRSDGNISDVDLDTDVRAALVRSAEVPDHRIGVDVDDGVVTLTGDVTIDTDAYAAEHLVETIPGVTMVVNKIDHDRVWTWQPDHEIRADIERQLFWSPFVDGEDITVTVDQGVATLEGDVDDYDALKAARENAWEGGAKDVQIDLDYINTGS